MCSEVGAVPFVAPLLQRHAVRELAWRLRQGLRGEAATMLAGEWNLRWKWAVDTKLLWRHAVQAAPRGQSDALPEVAASVHAGEWHLWRTWPADAELLRVHAVQEAAWRFQDEVLSVSVHLPSEPQLMPQWFGLRGISQTTGVATY